MHKVFIPSGPFHIERQIPKANNKVVGNCEFIFDENEDYDYFVTLDGLSKEITCKVDKAHRLLFLGEPPYVKQYNDAFLNQYGHVFSCQKRKIERGQANRHFPLLPWMLGISLKENSHSTLSGRPFLTYDDFKNMTNETERLNKCCLITSNKKMTKGHRDRVRFADYILKHHFDVIDIYGNGYKSIPDKFDILRKYKYAIVIENCQYQDYWTEKIGDCFLAGCYPIYHGCPNIDKYFPEKSFTIIDVRKMDTSILRIREILDSDTFETVNQEMQNAKKFVLEDYNIFFQLSRIIDSIDSSVYSGKASILSPLHYSLMDKIRNKIAGTFEFDI